MSHRRKYSSKYSTYKRFVTSTEVSYGSHTARSSYQREASSEYSNAKGTKSSTKEVVSGSETHSLPVFMAIQDFTPEQGDKDSMPLEQGQIVEVLDNKNPSAWLVRTKARPPRTGWVPGSYFETPTEYYKQRRNTREITGTDIEMTQQEEAIFKRDAVYQDLLRSEEEFVNELRHIIENYIKVFEESSTPDTIRHLKDQLTLNLRELYNFHANVLLKGLQYYADDPGKVSQTFVRLERDFDHHVKFCGAVSDAEKILEEAQVKEFFDRISSEVETGDKKFVDYLQLPRLRLQQYQQFFKEFIKYSARAELNTRSLQRALELMLSIPQRANDLLYIRNIQQYPGDIVKLGRLLRHENFFVWEGQKEGDGKRLYAFLFKSKLVLSQRIDAEDPEDLPNFKHVATIRLDKYDIEESGVDDDVFIMKPLDESQPTFFLKPADASAAEYARQAWVKEITTTKETLGPDEGPPRKKTKSPPSISPSASSQSLYSGSSGEFTGTATTLDMQGTRVTRTAYGFRTLQESSAKMCLKVSGYPLPIITWFKEDVQLTEDERHTFYADDEGFFAMTIDPVRVEDTGKYTCVASNEYGKANTSAFFRVMKVEKEPEAPKFVNELKDCDITEGEAAQFQCDVEGWPEPDCVWLVDGQVLHPSHDFKIEYDGQKASLEIRDAQPEDSGTYTIRLTNELGVKESAAILEVQASPDQNKVAPEFQQTIDDIECWEGDTIRFKSVVTGDPLPDVTWIVNGVPLTESEYVKMILEDGICMMTIKNVTKHFDGEVTCRAINRLGETSCTAMLTVRSKPSPPKFDKELTDRTVSENETAVFEAVVSGNPEPDITWHIGDKKLDSNQSDVTISYKSGGICRLELDSVQLTDSGEVVCKAENVEGSAESKAMLKVEPAVAVAPDQAQTVESAVAVAPDQAQTVEPDVVVAPDQAQTVKPTVAAAPQQSPTFDKELEDKTVTEGDHVQFEVKVSGEPTPTVTWYLDGQQITDGTSDKGNGVHVFALPSVTTFHTGQIKCIAQSPAGSAETKANLTVNAAAPQQESPQFTKQLQDKTATEGDSVEFEVAVTGEPTPVVKWSLNGQPIADDDVIDKGDGVYILKLSSLTPSQSGEVKCTAESPAGSAETKANLTVNAAGPPQKPPQFSKQLQDKTVAEGDSVEFEVEVTGEPTPEVKWFLNGQPIADDDIITKDDGVYLLKLSSISASESGEVKCTAESAAGTAETKAKLKVSRPPKAPQFNSELSDTAAKEGEPIIFEADIDGEPKPEIIWYLNGNQLDDGHDGIKLSDDKTKIEIPKAKQQHNGEITCQAKNASGMVESSAKIEVISKFQPPKFTKGLTDATVKQGETAEFVVEVTGEPTPKLSWYLNGNQLDDGQDGITISPDRKKIEIPNVKSGGEVECKAENPSGSVESSAKLAVTKSIEAPKCTKDLSDKVATEGEKVKFETVFIGEPKPEISWLLNGNKVQSGNGIKISTINGKTTLEISAATLAQAGTVTCTATNAGGSDETKCDLIINKKPKRPSFDSKLEPQQVMEGEPITAKVAVTGEPKPKITWYSNGKELNDGDGIKINETENGSELEIANAEPGMTGDLSCKAQNSQGTTESKVKMKVDKRPDPPVITKELIDQMIDEKENVSFTVEFTGTEPKVTWSLKGKEVATDAAGIIIESTEGKSVLSITNGKPDQTGPISCKLENISGTVESNANLAVVKKKAQQKPEFQSPLAPIDLNEGDLMKTKVMISGFPTPKVKWYINDRIVVQTEDTEFTDEDGVYTLSIDGASTVMTGTLKCVAYNKLGEVTTTAPIKVIAPIPVEFEQSLSDAICREGDTLKLKAVLLGEPEPEVTWFVNNKKLVETSKVTIKEEKNQYTVIIKEITCDYSGTVLCKAVNEFGDASSSAKLTVLPRGDPPDFTEWLSNVQVREDSSVSHKVVFTGNPTPVLKWYINTEEVTQSEMIDIKTVQNVSTLTIKKFTSEHVGEIICTAENDAGEVSCTAQMNMREDSEERAMAEQMDVDEEEGTDVDISMDEELVRVPTPIQAPRFITKLKDTKVKMGRQAIFECVVPESKGVVVKWLKDGKEVEIIARIRITSSAKDGNLAHQLVIDNVDESDQGVYTAVVSNEAGDERCTAQLEVIAAEFKPRFEKELETATVTEHTLVEFKCVVIGQPTPDIRWFKDGKLISEDGKYKIQSEPDGTQILQIIDVTVYDVGQYKVEASNTAGTASSQADLIVKEDDDKPTFSKGLKSVNVKKGDTAVMECGVTGKPRPKAKWTKDGEELTPDGGHIKEELLPDGTLKLTIADAGPEDVGTYGCVIENNSGTAKSEADVDVNEEPSVTKPLKKTTVKKGDTVEMECGVTGRPQPDVKWTKDGQEVIPDGQQIIIESSPDGTQKLILKDAQTENVGVYQCVAVNKAGKTDTSAPLEVQTAPVFTKELEEGQVFEGESTVMQCALETTEAKPEIHWMKDGQEIKPDGQHITIESLDDGTQKLHIQIARSEDVGIYKCEAVNLVGKAETQAPLKVEQAEQKEEHVPAEQAPAFVKQLHECQVNEGETAALECALASIVPKPEIHWLKDDKEIVPDGQHILIESLNDGTQKLVIQLAKSEDVGVYKCEAKNKVGKAETHAPLEVKKADQKEAFVAEEQVPEFTKQLHEAQVMEGQSIALECAVAASGAKPEIHWMKDEKEIVPDGQHIIVESSDDGTQKLLIQLAKSEDVGVYKCEAKNKVGKAETHAPLEVKKADQKEAFVAEEQVPEFTKQLHEAQVMEGQSIALECAVAASGAKPEIHWMKDEKEIVPDGQHIIVESLDDGTQKLLIQLAKSEDVGVYKCEAKNKVGKVETHAPLEVKKADQKEAFVAEEQVPEFTKQLHDSQVMEGQSVALECAVAASGETPEIHWMKDEKEIVPDGQHIIVESLDDGTQKLVIQLAKSEDVGVYKCEARNKAGKAETHAPLQVQKGEEKQEQIHEEHAPQFIKPLDHCFVQVGDAISLECIVASDTKPEIHWLKDGEEIIPDGQNIVVESLDDGTQKLVIKTATASDVGVYKCEAINKVGKAKTEGKLDLKFATQGEEQMDLQEAPEFVQLLESKTVQVGESVLLSCAVAGTPTPEIKWLKDNEPLIPDSQVTTKSEEDGGQILEIKNAKQENIGHYKCEAINPIGSAWTEGTLHVKVAAQIVPDSASERVAPEFLKVLHSCDVPDSGDAWLECKVTGMPTPTIKWYKDLEEIKPDDEKIKVENLPDGTQRLVIKQAHQSDIGEYRCVAENEAGTAWTEAPVTVKIGAVEGLGVAEGVAPDFVEPMHSVDTTTGETVTMECKASGQPEPEIKWYKDGEPLVPDEKHAIKSEPDGTQKLVVKDTRPEDIGEYRCEATNPMGVTWSDATLGVKEVEPKFIEALQNESVEEGELLTIACKVTGDPKPKINWYKDNEPLATTDPMLWIESKPDGTQRLTLPIADLEHAGEYKCEAVNSVGTACSVAQAFVKESTVPEFLIEIESITVSEEELLTVTCQVVGEPIPEIEWFKDDEMINLDDPMLWIESRPDGTQRLTLPMADMEHAGEYKCQATNFAGTACSVGLITITAAEAAEDEVPEETAPEFLEELKPINVEEGQKAAFECRVAGQPIPDVKWYRDGQQLRPSTGIKMESLPDGTQRLIIGKTNAEDQGNYRCEADNAVGTANSKAPLTVSVPEEMEMEEPKIVAPTFKQPLRPCKVDEGATAAFECAVAGSVEKVVWFKGDQQLEDNAHVKIESFPDGRQKLSIKGAEQGDVDCYYCVVSNPAGEAKTDAELSVAKTIKLPAFLKELNSEEVSVGATVKLKCQADVEKIGEMPDVTWMKDGKEMFGNKRIELEIIAETGICRLTITTSTEKDMGKYTCLLTNKAGKAKTEGKVVVQALKPPELKRGLESQSVPEGSKIQLEIEVEGQPKQVKFYKGNKELDANKDKRIKIDKVGDGVYRLTIDDATEDDAGKYGAEATNDGGTSKSEGQIGVTVEKPQFMTGLTSQTVLAGEDCKFEAVVSGGRPKSVKWYKNGREVKTGGRVNPAAVGDNKFQLTINSTEVEDAGTYKIILENSGGLSESEASLTVKQPLKIKKGLQDQTVIEGQSISMAVEVVGKAKSVKWYKNGQELTAGEKLRLKADDLSGRYSVDISGATKDVEATYTIELTDDEDGTVVTSEAKLTVKLEEVSPKFVIPLSGAIASETKSATFEVKVRGKPDPTLKWLKDGVALDLGERITVESMADGRYRLTITDVQMTDAGSYSCIATNSVGSEQCDAVLRVQPFKPKAKLPEERYAPSFNVPLHDRRIPEGQTMSVECHVDAKPKAEIKWTKEGMELELSSRIEVLTTSDGKCRLVINEFTLDDVGTYKCTATNELGHASTQASLGAEQLKLEKDVSKKEHAPRFTQDLSDKNVKPGSSVTLECKVDALPTANIQWFKDGIPIKFDSRVRAETLEDGTCRLTINQVLPSDDGAYRCVATNHLGSTNTACLLGVEVEKVEKKKEGEEPYFLKGLTDVWIDRGADIILSCQVAGDPRPEIKWFKDGNLLRSGDRIQLEYDIDNNCVLHVKRSTLADEGMYRCEATNTFGTAKTIATTYIQTVLGARDKVKIDEGEAPRFILPLEDTSCALGSVLELECKVLGRPDPTVKWTKDGSTLYSSDRITIEPLVDFGRYRLTVKNATPDDDGTYRCVATNDAGSATTKAFVRMDGSDLIMSRMVDSQMAPKFVVPLGDARSVEGSPLRLECKLEAIPLPEVTWYKDGEKCIPNDRMKIELFPDGTARLWINNCIKDDDGVYRVQARNSAGSAQMKASASVRSSTKADRDLSLDEVGAEKAPKVVIPLEGVNTKQGHTFSLSCKFSGMPKPTLKLFKDGDRIYPFGRNELKEHQDGTVELIIKNATMTDAGSYRCVAENDVGTARTTGYVSVEAKEKKDALTWEEEIKSSKAPGFSQPITVRRVQEGASTMFECVVYGNPLPAIRWLKDGMDIIPCDRVQIQDQGEGVQRLIINDVISSDDGFYRCVASNPHGTTSTKAELIFEVDPDRKAKRPRLTEDDVEAPESKARFRRGLQNITVQQGTPVEFQVMAVGKPKPTVKWYKNGQELRQNDKTLIFADEWGMDRLVILNSSSEDEAEYSCEAVNKLGSSKTEATLTVLKPRTVEMFVSESEVKERDVSSGPHYPPGFIKQLKNKHSFTGMPVIFDCIVTGRPMPTVQWFHNGKKIEPTDRIYIQFCGGGSNALVILRATQEDMGEYVAVATNDAGQVSSSSVLDVTVPYLDKMSFDGHFDLSSLLSEEFGHKKIPYTGVPTPPDRGPFIAEVTGHYLTLSWIPTKRAPPRYPQVTYVVEMRELPDRGWVLLDYNIPEPVCKVRNMELCKSYQFRVRAENIYGISDPSPSSPPSQLMAPPKPVLDKNKRPVPILDPYTLSAMDKAYGEQYASAPWFAPQEMDKMYCAENETLHIPFFIYGFPDPDIKWTFRGWDVDTASPTSRFSIRTMGGAQTVLTIRGFLKEDTGQYQCFAKNEYGDAQQNMFVELAVRPNFIQSLTSKTVFCGRPLRLDARIDGNPYPEIKWLKDWHPVVESSRLKIVQEPPYLCSLVITDPILRDAGIYSCTAVNEAGKVSTSATLAVEATPDDFDVEITRRKVTLTPRKLREIYEVDEEVVQKDGLCSIHRVKEKSTGRLLLAKWLPRKYKEQLQREIKTHNFLWHDNISAMYDACIDADGCWLIFENASGSLLEQMTGVEEIREDQVAFFIRQLLQALQHLHSKNMAHLDLRPENIVISESNQSQIKLMDFGQSKKLRRGAKVYGTVTSPEFVAPEIALGKPVSLASDLWSVGVLTYVLLSGISPFHGDSDRHTLENVTKAKWTLSPDQFDKVSDEAKDFLTKLLILEPKKRLNVSDALDHPWIQEAETKQNKGEVLSTSFLKEFKYRHNWVERRVFVQQNAGEETVSVPLAHLAQSMEAAQPLYGRTLSLGETPETAHVSLIDDDVLNDGLDALERVSRTIHRLGDKSYEMRHKEQSPSSSIESPLPPFNLIKAEHRQIEEEIANRILSDISEEGSVASVDDLEHAKPFHRRQQPVVPPGSSGEETKSRAPPGSNLAQLLSTPSSSRTTASPSYESSKPSAAALGTGPVSGIRTDDLAKLAPGMGLLDTRLSGQSLLRPDRDKTPTQDELDRDKTPTPADDDPNVHEGAPVVVASLHQLTIQTDHDRPTALSLSPQSPRKSGKSPVRLSPTKEAIMEVVIAMKHGHLEDVPKLETAKEAPKDDEFERLMAEVEKMKQDFRQRRKEILNSKNDIDIDFSRPEVDVDDYDWDSNYQIGPETYLLAQKDVGLSSRIREYRRELWGDSASIVEYGILGWRNKDISVRERRRYTDVLKEEPALQKSASVMDANFGTQRIGTIRRVRSDIYVPPTPPDAIFRRNEEAFAPVFRTRLKETMFVEDGTVTLSCTMMGRPRPDVTWMHHDTPIVESARHKFSYEGDKATLIISPAVYSDSGPYTCLAENDAGESSSSARIKIGDLPERPSRPDVELASDTELFMKWEQPLTLGGMDILNYKLEYRRAGEDDWSCPWMLISDTIDEEAIILRHLEPMGIYQFRVTAKNAFGFGTPSLSSRIVRTHQKGAPKLNIDILKNDNLLNVIGMPQRSATQTKSQLTGIPEDVDEEQSPAPETRQSPQPKPPLQLNETDDPTERYDLESEIFRGRFCIVRNAVDKRSESSAHCVAKIILSTGETDAMAVQEFSLLRDVQHENIVNLLNAYVRDGFVLLFMERLHENIFQRFTSHDHYNEDNIVRVAQQILSATQWMHFHGIVHVDIQPENVMFTSKRTWNLKLTDFGSAVRLKSDGPTKPRTRLNPDFAAPELLGGGVISPAVDVWGMGMVVFFLISGFHPFTQEDQTEAELIKAIQEEKLDCFLIFNNASQESLRFVTWALKRHPNRRMNTVEGLQHRWLAWDDVMVRRRENIKFSSNRFRKLAIEYGKKRKEAQTHNADLVMNYGQQ